MLVSQGLGRGMGTFNQDVRKGRFSRKNRGQEFKKGVQDHRSQNLGLEKRKKQKEGILPREVGEKKSRGRRKSLTG